MTSKRNGLFTDALIVLETTERGKIDEQTIATRLVLEYIQETVPPAKVAEMRSSLEIVQIPALPEPGRWQDRILLAILVAANGKLGEFRRVLHRAELDWRDVLLEASFQHGAYSEMEARLDAAYR